jgi:ribonuclease HII
MKTENPKCLIEQAELDRLKALIAFETAARQKGYKSVAGVDEAGRGPLAGPVAAAACVIPSDVFFKGINDSKQLSSYQRSVLFDQITSDSRVHFAIETVSPQEIDKINIYQATIVAMLAAIKLLILQPDFLLVDGMQLPHPSIPCQKIIKGDAKSQSIAAASILAKVTRDRLMEKLHLEWPEYGFDQHKGYATARHVEALKKWGPCPIHRFSFEPIKSSYIKETQLEFSLL